MKKSKLTVAIAVTTALLLVAVYTQHHSTDSVQPHQYPDRTIFGLYGNVSQVISSTDRNGQERHDTIIFSKEGEVAAAHTFEGKDIFIELKRNSKDYIIAYSINCNDYNVQLVYTSVTYNNAGKPDEITSTWYGDFTVTEKLFYGNDGCISKKISTATSEGLQETIDYKYTVHDSHGNWTERECTATVEDTDSTTQTVLQTKYTEKRRISYY